MMKKLVSLLMVIAVLIAFASVAFGTTHECDAGDTGVKISYSITSEDAAYVQIQITYSSEAFTWKSATDGTGAVSSGSSYYTFGNSVDPIGTVGGTITFDVLATATGGNYAFPVTVVNCQKKGGETTTCSVSIDSMTVVECKHQVTNEVTITPPTCTVAGVKEIRCTKCEKVISTGTIDALHPAGHTALVTDAAVEADCTNDGKTEGEHCNDCGAVTKAQEVIVAKGHSYNGSGVCDTCGYSNPEYGYLYTATSATTCTITEYFGTRTNLTITSKLGGATVNKIGPYAFSGATLRGVTIPGCVKTIDANAFSDCSSLKNVYIDEGTTTIGDNAFPSGCVINCYHGSYAESYATAKGYTIHYLDSAKTVEISVSSPITMDKGATLPNQFNIVGEYTTSTYVSTDDTIVKVDKNGNLTAVATGTASVNLTIGTETATLVVNVREAPTSFAMDQTEIWVVKGESKTLKVINVEPSGATLVITWSTSDNTVATVDSNGKVTGKFTKDAIITAKDMDGYSVQCTVHVTEAVTAIAFDKATVNGIVNPDHPDETQRKGEIQLIANVTCGTEKYTNKLVTFTSDNTAVATVDSEGKVTCQSAGTAVITAKNGSIIATCTVTVAKHMHDLEDFGKVEATCEATGMNPGQRCLICGYEKTQPSEAAALGHNPSAAVKENVIPATCKAAGSYDEVVYCSRCTKEMSRTAKTEAILAHTFVIVTEQPATCKEPGHTEGKYCSGCGYTEKKSEQIAQLAHTIVDVAAVPATYTTTGLTAGKQCSVCLTWTVPQKEVAKLTRPNPTKIELDHTGTEVLLINDTLALTAILTPVEASRTVTWTSSNPTVVSVTETGELQAEVKALSSGSAIITVRTANGKTATLTVVSTKPTDAGAVILTDGAEKIVHRGDIFTLPYTLNPSTATSTVSYSSANTAVVKVNDDGISFTALKAGTVYVTATASTGYSTQIKVTVHAVTTVTKAVEPTCETAGNTEGWKCSVAACGATKASTTIPALGHDTVILAKVEPTCTKTGLSEGVNCLRCKKTLVVQNTVPMIAHTEETDAAVAPTCTAPGKTEGKHCSVCGTVTVAQTVVAALGHTEGTPVIENRVKPTCSEEGSYDTVIYCSVATCGVELKRTAFKIDKVAHTEKIMPGQAATATEPGLSDYVVCDVCGTVLKQQTVIPATGGDHLAGDVNGDGTVNGKDSVRLMQYLAGWSVSIVEKNSDVNGDGVVNGKDSVRLMQYFAGWSVTLQ